MAGLGTFRKWCDYCGQNGLCQTLPTSHGVKVAILQRMVRKRFDRAANIRAVSVLPVFTLSRQPASGTSSRVQSAR